MALREFTDADGNPWKAWDVTPADMHPRTPDEEYLKDLAQGWLVFEAVNGPGKRRLCPYPKDWATRSDAELEVLRRKAGVVLPGGRGRRFGARGPDAGGSPGPRA